MIRLSSSYKVEDDESLRMGNEAKQDIVTSVE